MADILVHQTSPITNVRQLAGKQVSTPPASAIISMAGKHFLSQLGLTDTLKPKYVMTNSHNASIHAMLAGDTTAAIASVNISNQFKMKNKPVRKLGTTSALPGMVFLVARDLPKKLQLSFVDTLTQMNNKQPGQAVLAKMGYPGYRKTYTHELETARPYLNMYHQNKRSKRQ